MLTGKHLIDGQWVAGKDFFHAIFPADKTTSQTAFADGDAKTVDAAVQAGEDAFGEYSMLPSARRAEFLRAIARELDVLGDQITEVAGRETALPDARLNNERGRTVSQLIMFAELVESGAIADTRVTTPLPERAPPRPGICLLHRPLGPVAVFGASNFPLAFSAAGGDVASALAAGCPVVVKGHPAHPGTGELAAQAVWEAAKSCGIPMGVYSLVQGKSPELSRALVAHPLIQAVGFTGSLAVGRALHDVATMRPCPIPFYGEMGSINPMFLLPQAMAMRAEQIATGWVGSLVLGAGQFCTNPGVVVCVEDESTDNFMQMVMEKASGEKAQTMLTPAITEAFQRSVVKMSQSAVRRTGEVEDSTGARPVIFETDAKTWLGDELLREEIFGPAGIVVRCKNTENMIEVARQLDGQLTATLHAVEQDEQLARELLLVLERKAGRLIYNGFPTGVEVCEAMMHGGPYPASTHSGFTSVGALAVRRFLRPVCYQNFNKAWLPDK